MFLYCDSLLAAKQRNSVSGPSVILPVCLSALDKQSFAAGHVQPLGKVKDLIVKPSRFAIATNFALAWEKVRAWGCVGFMVINIAGFVWVVKLYFTSIEVSINVVKPFAGLLPVFFIVQHATSFHRTSPAHITIDREAIGSTVSY